MDLITKKKEISQNEIENKELFIKKIADIVPYAREYLDICDMAYIIDKEKEEWLYVFYNNGLEKRINISADSCSGILIDFSNNINRVNYINKNDKNYI